MNYRIPCFAWDRRRAAFVAGLTFTLLAPQASAGPFQEERRVAAPPIEFASHLTLTLDAATQSGRPVVVVFGAVWCPYCDRFQELTISTPLVRGRARDFHWVYVDIDRDVSLAREYGVTSTPHTIVLRADGTRLAAASGALDATTFAAFLDSI